ncbi:MAG: c-type cytochrome [Pontibacterium sp.]
MKKIASMLCALGLGFMLATSVQAATEEERIVERIKAVGSVCVEGDDTCGGAPAAAASGGARSAADVYTQKCAACHAVGVAGAPKFGASEWTDRAAKGMETLMANAINGINAMPPRGTCSDCSDDEIQGAIEHMIDSAK